MNGHSNGTNRRWTLGRILGAKRGARDAGMQRRASS
jgi:hypothetical protein